MSIIEHTTINELQLIVSTLIEEGDEDILNIFCSHLQPVVAFSIKNQFQSLTTFAIKHASSRPTIVVDSANPKLMLHLSKTFSIFYKEDSCVNYLNCEHN